MLALLLALATLLVTLSLFLIVQVRDWARSALVHSLLWAAIFGLLGYVLYGSACSLAASGFRPTSAC